MLRVIHTLYEGNQSVDFMTKLETSTNVDLLIHDSPPPSGLSNTLVMDVA